jgi:tetratricopeptide (TPR) repeat protein
MLDAARNKENAEAVYLPLVQLYSDREQWGLAEEYARNYQERFPAGRDLAAIYALRIEALRNSRELEEAGILLRNGDRPQGPAVELAAARIFWALESYQEVADATPSFAAPESDNPAEGSILRAQALRKLGRNGQALPLFEGLMNRDEVAEQASFFCGQIKIENGEMDEGVKILRRLAEKGSHPLWRGLARDTLDEMKI